MMNNDTHNTRSAWTSMVAMVAVAMVALASSAQAVVISFEVAEGFDASDSVPFNTGPFPVGIVDGWFGDGNTNMYSDIDGAGANGSTAEDPAPLTGTRTGFFRTNGANNPPSNSVTMDLTNSANLSLVSLWYANNGTFEPLLTLEYFGLDEVSLGSETFSGSTDGGAGLGLNAAFLPEFDLITVTLPAAIGTPLSKVVITSKSTFTSPGTASFFLEDITFAVPEPASLSLLAIGGLLITGRKCKR